MVNEKNVKKGSNLRTELDKQVARFAIAEDVIERIDSLLVAAPELFEADTCHAFGKVYSGDIQIAVRSIVENDESITEFYAVEDGGIVFTAERRKDHAEDTVSSVFIATGKWTEKFEKLENSVREAHYPL
ncbi:hypothetical protein IJ103_01410 [Candidatus Saccharibacteria bacterium]|nr:hypothetical protein [Candidatus Saccharibacteria bacterium]MBQ9016891.1 hypothetical protein [Candidatus Saccharibacteria bacterium]